MGPSDARRGIRGPAAYKPRILAKGVLEKGVSVVVSYFLNEGVTPFLAMILSMVPSASHAEI